MINKVRLDQLLVNRGLVATRSQAESYIKLGDVMVDGKPVTKPGYFAAEDANIEIKPQTQYVSRAALKLASVSERLKLDFRGKVVLDVGSSTGGFTEYALAHGAKKVIAVDVGTEQLHPKLRTDPRIELYEQTDVREIGTTSGPKGDAGQSETTPKVQLTDEIDLVLIDVSFISMREVLPHIAGLISPGAQVAAMLKPQFEGGEQVKHKGVIKNDRIRRQILQDFEIWVKKLFNVRDKADSGVSGAKGNQERFYLLQKKP